MSSIRSTYPAAMTTIPPPVPTDLGTYSRSMHDHTKRQMEAFSLSLPKGSTGSDSRDTQHRASQQRPDLSLTS
ncbi:hypothetical protein VTK26DRAFT_3663 [Humicola hyalothermophila]